MSVRHGAAHVGGKYPTSSTFLADGAAAIKAIGFATIKLYLSPSYAADYPGQTWSGTPTSVTTLAQDPTFAAILGDAQFSRIFLTVFTFANGVNNPWVTGVTQTMLDNEKAEVKALVTHLLSTYSNKEFFIQNWEGDWALIGTTDATLSVQPYRAERMAAFLTARQRAVEEARASVVSSSKAWHVVEVNRCLDRNTQRVHRDVIPLVKPDVVSFSAYETLNTWGTGQSDAIANIDTLLRQAVRDVRAFVGDAPRLVVGEFGWPEAQSSFTSLSLSVGGLIDQFVTTANALGITDCIYWQVYDDTEISAGNPRGYYLIKRDGTRSGAGTKYLSLVP